MRIFDVRMKRAGRTRLAAALVAAVLLAPCGVSAETQSLTLDDALMREIESFNAKTHGEGVDAYLLDVVKSVTAA